MGPINKPSYTNPGVVDKSIGNISTVTILTCSSALATSIMQSTITSPRFNSQIGFPPMPLIIETYEHPYTQIASLLFRDKQFQYLDRPMSEGEVECFCYTRAEMNPDAVRYYFNSIYYVEAGKIVNVNKASQKMKFYELDTGKLIEFERTAEESVRKMEFLPQLHAQNGEIVVFPDEDDE